MTIISSLLSFSSIIANRTIAITITDYGAPFLDFLGDQFVELGVAIFFHYFVGYHLPRTIFEGLTWAYYKHLEFPLPQTLYDSMLRISPHQ